MKQISDIRSDALTASRQSLGLEDGDAASTVAFNREFNTELRKNKQTTKTPDCINLALFEAEFSLHDATRIPFFVGFAVDYLCSVSPLKWEGVSTQDGLNYKKYVPKTPELLNETRYVRAFIDILNRVGFLDVLAGILNDVDPADVQLTDLDSDVTITITPESEPFTVKCDAFQQAVACINIHLKSINHPTLSVCDRARRPY